MAPPSDIVSWDPRAGSPPRLLTADHGAAFTHRDTEPVVLTCCGFIANRAALIRELACPGAVDDRELLQMALRHFGSAAARRIHGALSWVAWLPSQRRLLSCSDRLGVFPVHFAVDSGTWLLGFDPVSLANRMQGDVCINLSAAVAQLHALPPPAGQSFFADVGTLAGGSSLTIEDRGCRIDRYWQITAPPTLKLRSDTEYADALRDLLFEISAEYATEEKAGITLSSGLDSTTVAASLRAVAPGADLTAFSWIAPDLPSSDEDSGSSAVCDRLGIPRVTLRADRTWPLFEDDRPSTPPYAPIRGVFGELWHSTFELARGSGISVMYSGISGDNLFGGDVFSYPDLLLTGRWRRLLRQLRAHLPRSEIGLAGILRWMILAPIVRSCLPGLRTPAPRPVSWLASRHRHLVPRHRAESPRGVVLPGRAQRLRLLSDPAIGFEAYCATRNAAAYGIEFRHPLIDHRLIEFAASLPTDQTFRAAIRKVIVREAMRDLLPASVTEARDKTYLDAVPDRGLRERETAKIWALTQNMRCEELGLVDGEALRSTYQAYLDRTSAGDLRFWFALALDDWLVRHFPRNVDLCPARHPFAS